jgi:hypothetical protein
MHRNPQVKQTIINWLTDLLAETVALMERPEDKIEIDETDRVVNGMDGNVCDRWEGLRREAWASYSHLEREIPSARAELWGSGYLAKADLRALGDDIRRLIGLLQRPDPN